MEDRKHHAPDAVEDERLGMTSRISSSMLARHRTKSGHDTWGGMALPDRGVESICR
jgi:hypothetical protein